MKAKPDNPDSWWSDSGFGFRLAFAWLYALMTAYYCLRGYQIEVKAWKESDLQ